mgnify:CR=1 FL=1
MATSSTTDFDLNIDDVIEESFERIGKQTRTGYDLKSARRSLNLLLSEWGNRGVHLWKVVNHTQNLVATTTTYTAPSNTSDILEAVFRNGTTDTTMTKISRSEYQAIPNKSSTGTPSQYYVRRNLSNVEINLYLTPNVTDTQINYFYVGRIEDVGAYTNATDMPFRFIPCMVSGLAYYLSMKYAPQLMQGMKLVYEDEFQRALQEDGSASSTHITPKAYYPGT